MEAESFAMAMTDRLTGIVLYLSGATHIPFITRRSPLAYLTQLHLLDYDFSGKQVLDVGSGKSRFAQSINILYGDTGAVAIPLDKGVQPKSSIGLKADAMDLVWTSGATEASNMVFHHLARTLGPVSVTV